MLAVNKLTDRKTNQVDVLELLIIDSDGSKLFESIRDIGSLEIDREPMVCAIEALQVFARENLGNMLVKDIRRVSLWRAEATLTAHYRIEEWSTGEILEGDYNWIASITIRPKLTVYGDN